MFTISDFVNRSKVLAQLSAESRDDKTENFGFLDFVFAFEWTRVPKDAMWQARSHVSVHNDHS